MRVYVCVDYVIAPEDTGLTGITYWAPQPP